MTILLIFNYICSLFWLATIKESDIPAIKKNVAYIILFIPFLSLLLTLASIRVKWNVIFDDKKI